MTSLMVIFILLLVASLNNGRAKTADTRTELIAALQLKMKDLAGGAVQVEADPHDPLGVLLIPPPQLMSFAKNSPSLPPGAEGYVKAFAPRLEGVVCSGAFAGKIESVAVEGHADTTGDTDYNIQLSLDRAASVVTASLSSIPEGPGLNCFEGLLTTNGRGNFGNAGKLDTPAALAQERRVVFKIRVRSQEEQGLRKSLGVQ